jgi:hypothetical protein
MPDGVSHVPPAHEMIDPLKDTTALIAQVRAGFVPQPEAAGAFGYDFRQAVEMIREANALLGEAGLALDTDPRRVAKSGAAQGRADGRRRDRRHERRSATPRDPSIGPSMTEPIEPGGRDAEPEPTAASTAGDLPRVAQRAITAPATVDRATRTVEVVWSTGARAHYFVPALGLITEELEMSPNALRMEALRSSQEPDLRSGRRSDARSACGTCQAPSSRPPRHRSERLSRRRTLSPEMRWHALERAADLRLIPAQRDCRGPE